MERAIIKPFIINLIRDKTIIFMESSSPSGKVSEPPNHRWTYFVGTLMAILTLTLPLVAIAYYSSNNAAPQLRTPYSLYNPRE